MENKSKEVETQSILFFTEDIDFNLSNEERIVTWIQQVIAAEQHELRQLNYIFCSDKYLHQVNVEYLQHDTYTDIITFPYASSPIVESDIFISVDRVKENATAFQTSFQNELLRVIIHGVLHLCGYGDKTECEKQLMREKEEGCIKLFPSS